MSDTSPLQQRKGCRLRSRLFVWGIILFTVWKHSWKEKEYVHRYAPSRTLPVNPITPFMGLVRYDRDRNPDHLHTRSASLVELLPNYAVRCSGGLCFSPHGRDD